MSVYRTISATDLKQNDSLKFSFKCSEFSENGSLPFLNHNDSGSSIVSELSCFSETEEISAEVKPEIESDAPTLWEMETEFPVLFKSRQSLDQFFVMEDFLSHSMSGLSEHFMNKEFDFGDNFILRPLKQEDFENLCENDQLHLIGTLKKIEKASLELIHLVRTFNDSLLKDYDTIKKDLKLIILYNSRSIKKFENSRVMFDTLKRIKCMLLERLDDCFCDNLNSLADEIIDLLYDFNQSAEEAASSVAKNSITSCNRWEKFHNMVSFVESNLSTSSNFIKNECTILAYLIHEIKVIYEEYISKFRVYKFERKDDKFRYEIVSFDDYIKSQKGRLSIEVK
ncbi:uncharacterized protein PRCAT00001876001 [Priceomyces carsonii]|uniref:uncharacterized protein n=1 Tax=Priceomyces carsonii TaxID=28549 RepID=UPI002EDAEB0A|nr:unnamed protein product [Priceomyces carsonii]